MSEIKIHPWEKHIAGGIIALLVLIIIHWPSISADIHKEPAPFIIEGCNVGHIYPEIIDLIKKNYIGVPDYKAILYLQPTNEKLLLNNFADLQLDIIDEGIIKLNNSYFYILLYDPEGMLRSSFPCFCDGTPIDLKVNAHCDYRDGKTNCNFLSNNNPRFVEWPHTNKWIKDDTPWECPDKNMACMSGDCIFPQNLLSEKIEDKKILYRFKVDKLGEWKAFAFLYERQYKIREEYGTYSGPFNMNDILKRAIAFTETEFRVINEKEENRQFKGFTFWQVFSIIIAFAGYFSLVNDWYGLYKPIRRFITLNKKKILWIILQLLVVAIISWFFSRITCPLK